MQSWPAPAPPRIALRPFRSSHDRLVRRSQPGECASAPPEVPRCRRESATIYTLALLALCHPPQFSGMVPPLVLRMAVIMPPSNPFGLAWEPAIVNIPNAALLLVMLHAPVRPSSGVGPGVAAATLAPAPVAASVRAVTNRVVRALIFPISFPLRGRSVECRLPHVATEHSDHRRPSRLLQQ